MRTIWRRLRRDDTAVGGALEDLVALLVVVVVIVLFITSLTTIYRIKDDQERRMDLYDKCLSFSHTILAHPMLLEEPYQEEGLFSASKLLALKEAQEGRSQAQEGQSSGDPQGSDDGMEENPLKALTESVHSDGIYGWMLLIQDVSDYPTRDEFTFSLRSSDALGHEVQSLVWTISIFVDINEVHAARLTVLVWEVI